MSWGVAHGRPRNGITDGEERFCVEEGSSWTLKWRGGHFTFTVPVRMTPHALPEPWIFPFLYFSVAPQRRVSLNFSLGAYFDSLARRVSCGANSGGKTDCYDRFMK